MTDHNDDLMKQLGAADPIDSRSLPSALDPSPQQLLENAMTENPMNETPSSQNTPATGSAATELLNVQRVQSVAPRRGRGMLIGAAAAVLLLIAGIVVLAPNNTPSAVAAVQSAAQATADADTGRITTTFAAMGNSGDETEQLAGGFEASFSGSDIAFSLDLDDSGGQSFLDEVPISDARLVDDILYLDDGGQWFAVDTEGYLGQLVTEFVDPRSVLETVQELTETEEVGTEAVDGVETTHYRSVVDLADESLSRAGWLGFEGVPIEAEGEVTVDLFVDGDGVLRRLDISGDVSETAGGVDGDEVAESGTFEVSTRFYDIGSDITIEAPADAEVVNPLQGLFND